MKRSKHTEEQDYCDPGGAAIRTCGSAGSPHKHRRDKTIITIQEGISNRPTSPLIP